jgi:hypothetical protein
MRGGLPLTAAMRAEFGAASGVRRLGSSPRSRVWSAELDGTGVVVKQSVGGGDAAVRFAVEVAALRIAARAGATVAAPLLAADEATRVMVLGRVERTAPGPDWPLAYASALARLHATGRPADTAALPRWSGPTASDVEAFCGLAQALGVPASAAARGELAACAQRLAAEAGRQHALLHGDPCPGNDLYTTAGAVFVDFEQAALGSGAVELAYLRIGFPTCWGSMGLRPEVLAAAGDAYASVWRELTGAAVPGDPVDACVGWLIRGDALVPRDERGRRDQLARAVRGDWQWGPGSARDRLLHRLAVVSGLTAERKCLTAIGALTAAMLDRARDRWPGRRALPPDRDPRADE